MQVNRHVAVLAPHPLRQVGRQHAIDLLFDGGQVGRAELIVEIVPHGMPGRDRLQVVARPFDGLAFDRGLDQNIRHRLGVGGVTLNREL
jgi:hypothetical protein